MRNRRFSRPTALAGAAALALTLAACGGTTTAETATSEPATAATTQAPADSTADSTAEATDDATATDDQTDGATDSGGTSDATTASAAVTTAEAQLDGSRAVQFDIDGDGDDNYEVTVTDGNTAQEIEVSPDGTSVVSVEDEDVDADDRAKFNAIEVDMLTAIDNALAERPGTVTEVELDEDNGIIAWQIEIDDQDVGVDASTGQIINR